jgi:hypothetical protein
MSSPDRHDEGPADTTAAEPRDGETPAAPPPARRRDPRFRAELIERLPKLGFASWSAKEDFKVDEEWAGIVSLRSDAVLGPLEPLAPERRGQ